MTSDIEESNYVTFPICWLEVQWKSPADVTEREGRKRIFLIRCMALASGAERLDCLTNDGELFDQCIPTKADELFEKAGDDGQALLDFFEVENGDELDERSQSLAAAMSLFGETEVPCDSVTEFFKVIDKMRTILTANTGRKLVRMRRDIYLDAESGEFTWREFAVLSAIYACLNGTKRKAELLYYSQIAAMASGYGGDRIAMEADVKREHLLTRKQTRTTVADLWNRNMFSKVPGGRGIWVSIRLKQSELVRYVATVEQRKKRGGKSSADARKAVMEELKSVPQSGDVMACNVTSRDVIFDQKTEAPERAPSRAPERAPTGETLSGETLSGKTLSGKTTGGAAFKKRDTPPAAKQTIADLPIGGKDDPPRQDDPPRRQRSTIATTHAVSDLGEVTLTGADRELLKTAHDLKRGTVRIAHGRPGDDVAGEVEHE